ncbi:daple-like protein isoform X2 [Actinia tenebrosa]|uniref:Daple-like protein isoform X2 n=1 Tax=Actinia tenebrosa TaxID=6105 RepID=A0A6P8IZE6_ACTTE|nr:daple-like protein isoform X2 [Actinia tenebrosa]
MSTVAEFFGNPLVTWVNTFKNNSPAETINEFADGVFLNEIMVEIDPTYFTLTRVHQNVDGDTNIRIQNLDILVRHLKAFYQEKLQQVVLLRAPDVVAIAHHPDSDVGLQELIKILLLMLGCAVQCDSKESFIEKIKELDLEVQKHLVDCIKEITENPSHVLTFRPNELQDSPMEHVIDVAESMFYQMCHLVEERDQNYGVITHLSLEKDSLLQEKQRSKSPRPFSPPPSVAAQLSADSPSLMASREKIRMLTEELEEKNSLFAELKEEMLASKKTVERLRQENKLLSQDAILVKTYRDQMDMLKSKADKVEKLETDAAKFKEKLRDLEYLKKRAEELKEENQLLYDNKVLLEGQLSGMSSKEERIEFLEEENKKLKSHIHHLAEERQYDQEKMKEVMASNAQLTLEKQESMAEVFSLSAEIEVLRGKSPLGSVNLASECNESSSMDVLRLSHQNQHLKQSLEDLRGASAKLIDLERENRTLHDKYLEEKSTNHRLSQELAKFKVENKQRGTEVEKLTRSVRALQDELHMSSGELKQRREVIAHLEQENYSQATELEDKTKSSQDQEGNVASLAERAVIKDKELSKLANKNNEKEAVISDMKKRIQEKESTIEELSDSLAGKERQLKSLQSRLDETVEEQQKGDEFIRKQKKEIAELENRLEETLHEKKKYQEDVRQRESEVQDYTQRLEEIQGTKSKSDENLKRKDKETYELKNRLQSAVEDSERLSDEIKAKDQKIQALQKKIEDLSNSLDESNEDFNQKMREKEKHNKQLERRIEELVESLGEVEKMKDTVKQKDEKIVQLTSNLDVKDKQNRELDIKLEDSNSERNKLLHTIKLKEKKIDALESSLSEIENSSVVAKDDRITEMKKALEVRDNRIVELENKLEDLTSSNNKLQHGTKLKDEKIAELESRVEEIESLTFEKTRLSQNLDLKMRQIIDIESSLEDFKGENQRLLHSCSQKSTKVKELETKVRELESYVELSQGLQQTLKHKEEKISTLVSNMQVQDERLTELEHCLEDEKSQNHKLTHSMKIKEEKIASLEKRMEESEVIVNESFKLSQSSHQKDERIKALEDELDELDDIMTTNEKLLKSVKQKDDKINRLQDRLDEVEDAVNLNNKLNQYLKHRDDKIKALGKRILELEATLEMKEREQIANAQANYTKIRELEARLEEYVQEREAKVHALQSQLDGSVNRYRKMDMTIGEKDMMIAELEARLSEAKEAGRENNKLNQMLKAKDARLTELENRVQSFQSSMSNTQLQEKERNEKLETLQKRLEETLNLNNKLDQSVRKKEENIRTLEKTLQSYEKREEELEVLLETRTDKLSGSKKRVLELMDMIERKDNEIEELRKRLEEFKSATSSEEIITAALKEKDSQLADITRNLEEMEEEKRKMANKMKLKEQKIETLEKQIEELDVAKYNKDEKRTIKQNETRISILTQNNKKLESDLYNMESKLEETNSQVNKLSRTLDQKEDRIKSLKSRLEDAVHQNNKLNHALELKDDKIKNMEDRLEESSKQIVHLREGFQGKTPEKDQKPKNTSTSIIFKPAYNSRDDRKTVQMLSVADKRIADLNEEIRALEKQNATIKTQSEAMSSRNAQLEIEMESLRMELQITKGDYACLVAELNEARDYYHQLDLSATTMGHRCEMLSQLNATLEEENKALHDKVSWLMGQNRELMVKSLEEKDQFMEEERIFSDRLYNLQRTKEKLEEQIDLANKALSESAPPKKKPGFFKKVFQKAGLKKKKDESNKSKNPVQLLKVEYSDDVDTSILSGSEHPDDSLSSLHGTPGRRYDESSIASRESSTSGDSSRGTASKSAFSPNLGPKSEVVMRKGRNQPNYPAVASTSAMMSTREIEMVQQRKVSDVSAFRARQVRSEIFADNFNPGRLNRPKSLDNLNKIGGFRGSNDTLSSGSAVESTPNRSSRGHARITPPSSPINAFRVIPQQNSSPYSSPKTSKKGISSRSSSPPTNKSPVVPRRMRASPMSSSVNDRSPQYSQDSVRDPSTPPRSRRSSFSSAISGHESDQEMERIDNMSVSSMRSSIVERTPPPYPRDAKDESASKSKRSSIAERGPPPPYHRRPASGLDAEKREDSSPHSKRSSTAERRPPPYPRGPETDFQPEHPSARSPYALNRSASFHSRSGVSREEQTAVTRGSKRESLREKKTASLESREQAPRHSPLQTTTRRNERMPHTKDSPNAKNFDSSVDSESEVLIDATESVVSAVPLSPASSIASPNNVVSPSDNSSSTVKVASYIRQNESLQESPLRRMNSIPRHNARSRSMDESSPLKTRKEPTKADKGESCFAAVMVRQKSLTEEPLPSSETRSSDVASGANNVVRARVTSFEQQKPEQIPKSSTLSNLPVQGSPIRNDDDEDDRWSKISSGTDNSHSRRERQGASSPNSQTQRDDNQSEERSNSRNSSRASQQRDRKGTTHQWLEYGCV